MSTGIHFGLTSGVITTLGLMVGLNSGTHSTLAVVGGIITIAVADAMSDALGIHIAKEAENQHSHREVWIATISTFVAKFVMSALFVIPVLLLPLDTAVLFSVIAGIVVLTVMSYQIAKANNESPWPVISEHVGIAIAVVVVTHYIGVWVARTFG
jgi:VIT1/CCC1 family predicted Fe2+/Mn2+ transporter